jgi:hypothetical protein
MYNAFWCWITWSFTYLLMVILLIIFVPLGIFFIIIGIFTATKFLQENGFKASLLVFIYLIKNLIWGTWILIKGTII